VLTGTCANGLKLSRTIQLAGGDPVVRTQTTVQNAGAAPLEVALVSRIEADPASGYQDLGVAFRAQDGSAVEKRLIEPETQPSGSESYTGVRRPDGEWRIVDRRTGAALINRFPKDQVERCNLSWTAKSQKRVTLDVWSNQHTLKPGESFQLEADYRVGTTARIAVPYDE
jgi:hypothetical protein